MEDRKDVDQEPPETGDGDAKENLNVDYVDSDISFDSVLRTDEIQLPKAPVYKRRTKHMKRYPELYRSDVSINPSYTGLKNFPYYVVCRRRYQRTKKKIIKQLNKEIMQIAMMKAFAIDGVRVDRVFSVGFPPEAFVLPKFTTAEEDRRINQLIGGHDCGASPLANWGMHVKHGYIRRVTDDEVKSLALEIAGTNVSTTYIYCPSERKKVLGIMLPFFIMIIKNMKKYFTFEITILDDKNMHRRFRVSNFQSTTKVRPFSTSMPIGLSGGWNQIQFNLADFTRRAYGTNYVETTRMQIHANCRIRRIYFSDRLYTEDQTPEEFKLFLPMERKKCVREEDKKIKKPEEANVAQIMKSMPADEPPEFQAEGMEAEKSEMEVEAKASKTSTSINADESPAQVQEETPQEEHKDVTDTETEEEEEGIEAPEDEQESMQMKEVIETLEDATEESEFLTEEETEPEEPLSEEEG